MSAAEAVHSHVIEALYNSGWDDDPDWSAVCDCGWECWDRKTKARAVEAHSFHVADVLANGSCTCITCAAACPPPEEEK